ncbi:MAG: Helix-turn-helix domain [Clostridia bacterium]|jgi:hypothetical protein|nr:Helix-turn-helix domain [Clostridia bacterium]
MEEKRLAYRPSEAAQMIGVDKQTLTNWLNKGIIKGCKIEGCWVININEINRVIGIENNRPVLRDINSEYRKWFAGLNEKDKLTEIDRLLHS